MRVLDRFGVRQAQPRGNLGIAPRKLATFLADESQLLGGALGELAEYPLSPEQEGEANREKRRAEAEREAEEVADLRSMTGKALGGVYGQQAKAVALAWCDDIHGHPSDVAARAGKADMCQLRRALRKVPGRISG